jgi:hypothetical protein
VRADLENPEEYVGSHHCRKAGDWRGNEQGLTGPANAAPQADLNRRTGSTGRKYDPWEDPNEKPQRTATAALLLGVSATALSAQIVPPTAPPDPPVFDAPGEPVLVDRDEI